ncbi:hypothetical protein U1Q18_039701 [Sarracenia purpurea var. burkii]
MSLRKRVVGFGLGKQTVAVGHALGEEEGRRSICHTGASTTCHQEAGGIGRASRLVKCAGDYGSGYEPTNAENAGRRRCVAAAERRRRWVLGLSGCLSCRGHPPTVLGAEG